MTNGLPTLPAAWQTLAAHKADDASDYLELIHCLLAILRLLPRSSSVAVLQKSPAHLSIPNLCSSLFTCQFGLFVILQQQ